jgi:hypothetical protein
MIGPAARVEAIRRRRWLTAAAACALPAWAQQPPAAAGARVLRVGPGEALRRIGDAADAARDGDTVEILAGDYPADTAVWRQSRVQVRAVGGRVRLLAEGASAQDKAIWVVRCDAMAVEGLDFLGARVRDRNGAGIRLERGRLQLTDCRFLDNENGLLAGNDPATELLLAGCEFGHNGAGDGYSHNLYVGRIRRLRAWGCHFHHARVGHLLKSRAALNEVLGCVLDDGTDGRASYELEFPDGGEALVLANLIAQSPRTENQALVSFAAEGARGSRHRLVLVHNTLVDRLPGGGRFIDLRGGVGRDVLVAFNNLRCGAGRWPDDAEAGAGNLAVPWSAFEAAEAGRFRLRSPTPAGLQAVALPPALLASMDAAGWPRGWPAGHQRPGVDAAWIGAFGSTAP